MCKRDFSDILKKSDKYDGFVKKTRIKFKKIEYMLDKMLMVFHNKLNKLLKLKTNGQNAYDFNKM